MNDLPAETDRGTSSTPAFLLDGERARLEQDAWLRRLNTREIPVLRVLAGQLLILGVVLHNAVLLDDPAWERVLWYALLIETYVLITWAALRRWYSPGGRFDLGLAFLLVDMVPLAATVYATGADRSWVFWILLFRVGDQTATYFRRALLFTHLAALGYLAVVGYVAVFEGRPVAWPQELTKTALLYLGALYLATTARTSERIRDRMREAVHVARDAVARLSEKSAELERARAEAERARAEVELASQAKSQFLSRVSHELRTPMNAILGFAQLLEMDDLDEEHRAHVAEILEGGRHLLDIINEVMDIARVETGALASELRPVVIRTAIEEVLEHARAAAAAREVRLPDALPGSCDGEVLAHERKLRQVIANLVSNAIKYNSSPGSVEIACARVGACLRVSITDTGPGIREDELEAAFTPFVRLEAARSDAGGTGLGLPLARSLIQAMNGQLGVDSRPGEGSTFWFELPLADGSTAAVADGEAAATPGTRAGGTASAAEPSAGSASGGDRPAVLVLYIDDKPENVMLVGRILARRPGVELITAGMGAAGVETARSRRPDLVLLDLELPDIPGEEVLAALQNDPATRDIPVVVVSAEAAPARVERLLEAGARAYVTMPYDVVGFLETLDAILTGG